MGSEMGEATEHLSPDGAPKDWWWGGSVAVF
jgi:hypothetical protein